MALAGLVLAIAAVGVGLIGRSPAYQTDESSHVGYVLSLRDGVLPTLDTPVPTDGASTRLDLALARQWPFSVPNIHIANNPPHAYAAALPIAGVLGAAGADDGAMLGMRLVNLLGALSGIGFTYLLGRELGGGNRQIGLAAAALVGSLTVTLQASITANVDGVALAGTTAVSWALARFVRRRDDSAALVLGAAAAAAASARPMAMAFACAAAAVALALGLRARGTGAARSLLVRIGGPPLVVAGWFYALNQHRYGDLTGSNAVYDSVGGQQSASIWPVLFSTDSFVEPFDYLVTQVYGRDPWWVSTGIREHAVSAAGVAVVVAAVALAPRALRSAWLASVALCVVPVVLISLHIASGGAGHPRYLLAVMPVVCTATAFVLDRVHRWLPWAVTAAALVHVLVRAPALLDVRVRSNEIFAPPLRAPTIGWSSLGPAAAVLAAAGVVTSLVSMAWLTREDGAR